MKYAIIIAMALLASMVIFAQEGIHIGIVGGPQNSWLFNKNDAHDPNLKLKTSFDKGFFGPTVDYHFMDNLGVGTELLFSFQGQRYSDGSVLIKRDVNYFRIPLLLNFNTSSEHILMLLGKIGPEFNFLTSANQVGVGEAAVNNGSNYTNVNIGAVAGLGLGINIKKVIILSIGGRLDAGLTDALKTNPDPIYFSYYDPATGGVATSRAKTWNIAAGLEFGLKVVIPTGKRQTQDSRHKTQD